jgi:hypothetical protein
MDTSHAVTNDPNNNNDNNDNSDDKNHKDNHIQPIHISHRQQSHAVSRSISTPNIMSETTTSSTTTSSTTASAFSALSPSHVAKPIVRCSNVLNEQFASDGSQALIPRVAFEFPENILAWSYLRIVIQSFGQRFRFRTDLYLVFTLLMVIILMVLSLANIIAATDPADVFQSAYTIQAIFTVTVCVIFLVLIAVSGAAVNEELRLHSRTLAARLMKVRAKLMYREPASLAEKQRGEDYDETLLKNQAECIENVMRILDINNHLRPFKFLGMTASSALAISIITTTLSFYSVLASFYFGNTTIHNGSSSNNNNTY